MITLEEFKQIPAGSILAKGELENSPRGIYMTDTRVGDMLKWVAKKGQVDDWAVYCHWSESGYDFVLTNGDKIFDKANIMKCLQVDDEVMKLYRY